MAPNLQKVFVIVVLCIVFIFLSGILLPRYVSKQFFQLRDELNSNIGASKYNLKANAVHVSDYIDVYNVSKDGVSEKSFADGTISNYKGNTLQMPLKAKKRTKRDLSPKEHFSWVINLNITREQNDFEHKSTKNLSNISPEESLDVAVLARGKGKTAFTELQNSLRSMGSFLRDVFVKSIENKTTPEIVQENFRSSKENLPLDFDVNIKQNPDEKNERNGTEIINQRNREGKFISFPFDIFGLGKSFSKGTSSTKEGTTTGSTGQETELNSLNKREEITLPISTSSLAPKIESLNDSKKGSNFHPESHESQIENLEKELAEGNVLESSLSEQSECSNCNPKSLDSPTTEAMKQELNSKQGTTANSTESIFTDELLQKFCMTLVNKVEESQHSDADEGHTEPDHTQNIRMLAGSTENSFLNFSTELDSFSERGTNLSSLVIEDSFLVSNEDTVSENDHLSSRQSRFFSLLGFGSGRSAMDDESNEIKSEGFDDLIELENLPSILDCKNFFRKKQSIKMFPKPNFMDVISDPKIEFEDIANGTISSKLQEQQLQFVMDLIKTRFNNSVESFVKSSDTIRKSDFPKMSTLPGSESNTSLKEISIPSDMFTLTESSDFRLNDSVVDTRTESNGNILQTNELHRDSRFFNIFDTGSGSHERFLESAQSDFEIDRIGGFGSGDTFQKKEISDETSDITEEYLFEHISVNSSSEGRFFDFLGFGSGDGRGLPENEPEDTDDKCENCSYEVTTADQSYNCGNDGCSHANSYDHINLNNSMSENESICADRECSSIVTKVEQYDGISENFTAESKNTNKSLKTEKPEIDHGNCSCHKNSTDATFSDCDECNLDYFHDAYEYDGYSPESHSKTEENLKLDETQIYNSGQNSSFEECDDCNHIYPLDEYYETSESLLGKEIYNSKRNESLEDAYDCENCGTEKLVGKNETNLKKNVAYSECDKCNSHVQHTLNKSEVISLNQLKSKITIGTDGDDGVCYNCRNETDEMQLNENISGFENTSQSFSYETTVTMMEVNNLNTYKGDNLASSYSKDSESPSENLNEVQSPSTEILNKRIFGTIFLTGSGDGGLFGDSGGPINLVEEGTIASPDFPLRRSSRLDDILFNIDVTSGENNSKEFEHSSHSNAKNLVTTVSPVRISRRRGRFDDMADNSFEMFSENQKEAKQNFDQNKVSPIVEEFTTINPNSVSQRGGRNEDTDFWGMLGKSDPENTKSKTSIQDFSNNQDPFNSTTSLKTDVEVLSEETKILLTKGNEASTVSLEFPSNVPNSDVSETPKNKYRSCKAARECNVTLNERCLKVDATRICDCGRGFVRQNGTGKCIVKRIVETSIRLPAEEFDDELKNPFSKKYVHMKKISSEMMWQILQNSPELLPMLSEINVVEFKAGSLIVIWNLVFAVENKSDEELIIHLEDDLQKALKDESLIQKTSLNLKGASLMSINGEIDLCKSTEYNYCSVNAHCEWNGAIPGRYVCQCKENYRDVSSDERYIGETCIAKCSPEYCGPYGHCVVLENDEKLCLCSGLYFGRRCEVPGLYVLMILGIVAFISLSMLFLVLLRARCRRISYGESRAFRQSEEADVHFNTDERVSDAIALEVNAGGKVSKYTNVPITPAIKVTRPTITESSLSFDYDSTFDTTPSAPSEKDTHSNVEY